MIDKVSIIIVNYNGADVLSDCLSSIDKFIPKSSCEITVVDNNSEDSSPDLIAKNFPFVNLIKLPKNVGFGAGNNAGVTGASGEFLFFLNSDTIITSNILPDLIELMSVNPEVGIIGPKLLFPDGRFQISFAPEIGIKGEIAAKKIHEDAENLNKIAAIEDGFQNVREVDIVVGAAFFIRTELFRLLGGFDENFFMYFEESDLCQRVRNRGYKIIYTPEISLIHIRGHSVKKTSDKMAVEYRRSQIYYYHKHRPIWEILLLKIYLLFKFTYEYFKTFNNYSLKIIKIVFIYK